jgi:hypothetical protein
MFGSIKYIIFIILVFLVLVLGQQPFFEKIGRDIWQKVEGWAMNAWNQCVNFWNKHIFKTVTTEIEKRQKIAKDEIKGQAKEVTSNIWQKTKDYFIGIFNSFLGEKSLEGD